MCQSVRNGTGPGCVVNTQLQLPVMVCQVVLLKRINRKPGGIYKKGCRCGERLSVQTGGENLTHTRWIRGRGYLRRRQ